MVTRWNRRLLFGAIAVLIPTLAGCEAGLDAPTLEFHPASDGISTVNNGITIDNAFVLGPALNSTVPAGGRAGMFVALSAQNGDKLLSITAPGTASSVKITGGTVDLPSQSLVSLEGPSPSIVLTGLTKPLTGGETIKVVLNFATVGAVTLTIPVEARAYFFATYSPPAAVPTTKPKVHTSPSVSPGAGGTASAVPTNSPTSNPAGSPSPSSSS